MDEQHHEWLKVPEVARIIRVARSRAYELIAEGEIPSVRIGRSVRVSRRELERWLEEQRQDGLFFDAGNLKVGEYLDRWLKNSVEGNVRPRTLSNYQLQVRQHITPALGRIKLKTLTPLHVQGLYRQKLNAGLAPASVRYIHAVLHRALKQALRWGLVPHNVSEAVDLPKLVSEEVDALIPEEARAFINAARGDRFEALYVVAVTTGMRRGELLGLRWSDINLDGTATLRVARQLQKNARRLRAQVRDPEGQQGTHDPPSCPHRGGVESSPGTAG